MRWIPFAIIGLGLAGCAGTGSDEALWPGPGWQTAPTPAVSADSGALAPGHIAAAATSTPDDDRATRVPRERTRRGSGTPPDQLFQDPQAERKPYVVDPAATAAPAYNPPAARNDVLAPRNPSAPYSADGGGYQRQGTTILGPTGQTSTMVGSSIMGSNGRACQTVGTSLFCN